MSLKFRLKKASGSNDHAPSVPVETLATPGPASAVTPGGTIKPPQRLVFKTGGGSQPPTPVAAVVEDIPKTKKTKAGRASKPSAKLIESKKRLKEESESENEGSTIAVLAPPKKKLRLINPSFDAGSAKALGPKTPVILKAKVKGKPPRRPLGEGYDSEASDREEDPYIEEQFVLRMMPGEDCDYLRNAIAEKKIGLSKAQGGPDITMKFLHADGRRAAITIRGRIYAATLVDLPTIVEGMKSWDRRGWWKSADICQMLWVFASIKKEDEAKTIALPKIIDETTYQYPHGLTPPMHFARKRRFRKRISRTAIEAVEEAVEKLLAQDAEALSVKWEMLDPERPASRAYSAGDSASVGEGEQYSEDEDAEGEVDDADYFNTMHNGGPPPLSFDDDIEADLEADLEAAMQQESLAAETPLSAVGATPSMFNGGETPMVEVEEVVDQEEEEDDSEDESLEGDDGDDDNVVSVEADENEKARLAHIQSVKEDMADLEQQIEEGNQKLAVTPNPILRRRLEENIRKMKAELQLKISSLGEGEGED